MTSTNDAREALRDRIAFAVITGSAGERAATHAKEFQTGNWADALRSADAVLASLPDTVPAQEAVAVRMADNCEGDPWELLGYFRGKLEKAEAERNEWKERAMSLRRAALANHFPDAGGVGEREGIVAWLRTRARSYGHSDRVFGSINLDLAADAIERGEHRPDPRGEG